MSEDGLLENKLVRYTIFAIIIVIILIIMKKILGGLAGTPLG